MFSEPETLIKVDYSVLFKYLNGINDHLKKHDEEIAELRSLLRNIPSLADISKVSNDLDGKLNKLKEELNNKIEDNAQILRSDMKTMKDDADKKIQTLSDRIDQLVNQFDELKSKDDEDRFKSLEDQLNQLKRKISDAESNKETENKIKDLGSKIDENRDYINTIATAYSMINNSSLSNSSPQDSILGPSLKRTLYNTTDYVSRTLKKLLDQMKSLQSGLNQSKDAPTIIENTREIDLSGLKFIGTEIPTKFDETPQLPSLHKFNEVPEAIQYMYDSIPKLQGILKAIHSKVASINNTQSSDFDQDAFDKLSDTIRKALENMEAELNLLRNQTNKGLTRADVMRMIREMLDDGDYDDDQATAIGYVKCIACGREMKQVVGAMGENRAIRTLGAPPNSLATYNNVGEKALTQMYSNADEINGSYYESPKSRRPKRQSRKFKPHPPS